jgi:hypothetical protein
MKLARTAGMAPADGFYPLSPDQVWEEAIVVDDAVPEPPGKHPGGPSPPTSSARARP